jgi:hypothetical protein
MQVAAARLSLRWYLGYDLTEPLPAHSSLTKIRAHSGLLTFRRFFDRIVEQCKQAGLVWGKELYFDATQVEANADQDALLPHFSADPGWLSGLVEAVLDVHHEPNPATNALTNWRASDPSRSRRGLKMPIFIPTACPDEMSTCNSALNSSHAKPPAKR